MSLDVDRRLLEVFGLAGQPITELTVRAAVGEAPRITVTRVIGSPDEIRHETQQFTLVLASPEPPAAEDGDELVEQALQRVRETVDDFANCAAQRLRRDHRGAMIRLGVDGLHASLAMEQFSDALIRAKRLLTEINR